MRIVGRSLVAVALAALLAPQAAAALPSCGDANGAGGIGASDALLTLKKAVGHGVTCPECACDTTADHSITSADALAILRRAVGSNRYLSCFSNLACEIPAVRLAGAESASVQPAALVQGIGSGLPTGDAPALLRIFGGGLSVEIPAVALDSNRIAAAAPPLAAGVTEPAAGFRMQALVGSPLVATEAVESLSIGDVPEIPQPVGKVTSQYLANAIDHADRLLAELPAESAMASAVSALREVFASLLTEVEALRDLQKDSVPLGTRGGEPVVLTRSDLAQVDAMILASLIAQSELPDSASPAASSMRVPRAAGSDCRQQEAKAYSDALLHDPSSIQEGFGYTTATCEAAAAKTTYAVILGPPALAVGILALTGVTVSGVALALPAAAVLYVSLAGAGGLIAVGGALADTSKDAVALVKQGVDLAESTMQQMVTGQVLPEVTGTLYDMASAAKDLSEAFGLFDPAPVTTTISSSTTTLSGPGCYCCCAYWDGCPPCNAFTCRELASPQSPPDGEAFCTYYDQVFCDADYCESP